MIYRNKEIDEKGFTLVEIIVSIAIFSIVLAILGSVMVLGFQYFYQSSSTDLDKRSIDSLEDYVRSELLYATDVRISSQLPSTDDWYSFSVVDGKLHQYEDSKTSGQKDLNLFNNDDFYNYHSFKLTAKAYENSNRLDLKFIMSDDKEDLYTTSDTLELLNVSSITSSAFADELTIGENNLKIYYRRSKIAIESPVSPDDPYERPTTGTVADQIEWLNVFNTRYYDGFKYYQDTMYGIGDFVFYDGSWWRYMKGNEYLRDTVKSIQNGFFKKIDSHFTANSYYQKGDIVFYSPTGKYYKFIGDSHHDVWNSGPIPGEGWGLSYWEVIGDTVDKVKNLQCGDMSYPQNREKTVAGKMLNINPTQIAVYDSRKTYPKLTDGTVPAVKDFVKVWNNTTKQYQYYLKLFDCGANLSPGETYKSSNIGAEYMDWQLICVDAFNNNAYVADDKGVYNATNCFRLLKNGEGKGLGRQNFIFNYDTPANEWGYYMDGSHGFWIKDSY